jgi:microcystin-dependent protein
MIVPILPFGIRKNTNGFNLSHDYTLQLQLPVGCITQFAGASLPPGFLFCDGSAVSRVVYKDLFEAIGITYGAGDGVTTFNLPNFKGRIPVCVDESQSEFNTLAQVGGAKTHTLTINEMPSHSHTASADSQGSHTHTINDPGHTHSQTTVNDDFNQSGTDPPGFAADSAGSRTWNNINSSTTGITINSAGQHTHNITINSTGGSQPHNNLQPYIVVNYIIKCYKLY